MFRPTTMLFAAAGLITAAGSAHAFVPTYYQLASDPGALFGSPIQSLDIASTSWDFPLDGATKKDSGFKAEILDPNGFPLIPDPGVNPNTTSLRSDVYRVSSPTTVGGGFDLLAGDLVFAYRLRLTGNNANTVETLQEFSVGGIEPGSIFDVNGDAGGFFDQTIVTGRGFSVAGLANPTAGFPEDTGNNFDVTTIPGFGSFSQVDFDWGQGDQASQLQNAEEITLLLFARNAIVTNGFGKFVGVSGQAGATTDTVANNAPILIPTFPSPGAASLLLGAGLVAARRRRS